MLLPKSPIQAKLDDEIVSVLEAMKVQTRDSKEYAELLERLTKLHKLKVDERPKPVSADTVLVVVANIFGILWITRYERENVISSKSLGFVVKPRPH